MMKLQEFYRGEIRPDEEKHPVTEELIEARNAFVRHREKQLGKLDDGMREEMSALLEEGMEVAALEMEDAYIRGMRMGAQLTMELFEKKTARA